MSFEASLSKLIAMDGTLSEQICCKHDQESQELLSENVNTRAQKHNDSSHGEFAIFSFDEELWQQERENKRVTHVHYLRIRHT